MKSFKSFLVSVVTLSMMVLTGCGDDGNDIPLVIPPATTAFSVTTASLPAATVGTAYSQTLAAANGTTPYTWAVTTGTLPAGLTLSSAGVISGTPTTAATSNFTVTVTDSTTPTAKTATKALSITVNALPVLTITTTSLPAATVGTAYSQTLAASNGTTPYTWAVTVGTLPAGLTLSSAGVISGTPTTAATSSFTVTVTDAVAATDTQALTITVNALPVLTITTTSLPAATVGTAYSQTLAASNGTTPYTWAVTAGTLPAGLTLSSAGVISGTPTTAATSNFTVTVTDAVAATDTQALSITVGTVVAPLAITSTSPLPAATFGTAYSQTLAASGGTPPYTWATTAGALPAGLLMGAGGVISGTPTAPAVPDPAISSFTVGVTDAILGTATAPFTITTSLSASASAGRTRYSANCAGCHRLGIFDTTGGSPNLGTTTLAAINARFSGGASHNGQTMTAAQITEMWDFVRLY